MKPVWLLLLFACALSAIAQTLPKKHGILLEDLTWDQAEHELTPDRVVVIALGAESKEHGRHLRLNNDCVIAEYFKRRVLEASDVVVA
ncbi:MAG: hypothetical protein ACXVZV_14160, partial [Terriglobales bacterium]